jgi:hypothetical protein
VSCADHGVALLSPKLQQALPNTSTPTTMLDLDYGSDSDSEQTTPAAAPPPPAPSKPSGLAALLPKPKSRKQKDAEGVAKDAPKKIVVNLPKVDDLDDDAPPAKKARIGGGGGGSGLSALLPAPKRSGAAKQHAPPPPPPPTEEAASEEAATTTTEEIKKPAATSETNTMFVPQSVARKPIQPMSAFKKKKGAAGAGAKPKVEAPKPTVSLFGAGATVGAAPRPQVARPVAAADYKPIMLEPAQPMRRPVDADDEPAFEESVEMMQQSSYAEVTQVQPANDLDSLAREAGLDEAAVSVHRVLCMGIDADDLQMRQLYGRRGPGKEPIKITTFSVDEEYRQNELEKQLGLVQEVKPVRTVAPGRHQLSSLLNGEFIFGLLFWRVYDTDSGCSCASTEGCVGGQFCSGEAEPEGVLVEVWMVICCAYLYWDCVVCIILSNDTI